MTRHVIKGLLLYYRGKNISYTAAVFDSKQQLVMMTTLIMWVECWYCQYHFLQTCIKHMEQMSSERAH